MTASPPKANGSARPRTVQFADWRITTPATEEQRTPELGGSEPAVDLVAAAEAATIRARGEAEAEAIRVAAEAAAKAEIIKAEEEARKQKIANDRAAARFEEEQAARASRIAKSNKETADAERAAAAAAEQEKIDKKAKAAEVEEITAADEKWRSYALNFYRVCAVVALPVQLNAFYDRDALWLMAAPLMLEGGAWVVQKGAASAVANGRPSWHYRLIAWLLAFIAASINLWHGLNAFDPATAIGTAFASIAGPGVWDLHEHGRIRKRDGVPTRKERRAAEKAAKEEAKQRAAAEERRAAEKEAAEKAAEAARLELRETRQTVFKDVWAEAVRIGAALGKEPDDPAVWPRAYRNIKGCEPGESIESISSRRTAEKRVEAALTGTPVSTLSKTASAQRAIQIKNGAKRSSYRPVPPVRKAGDTLPYHPAARRAHGETKRRSNARQKDQ